MDFIFACAEHLSWTELAPFVLSARACAPRARLGLFVCNTDAETRSKLRAHEVELHPFDAVFPLHHARTEFVRSSLMRLVRLLSRGLRYPQFRRRLLLRGGALLLRRDQARFFAYLGYLEDSAVPGDRFLLCDARDLVFQADPFALLPPDGVVITQEEVDVPLVKNIYNALWYRETFGRKALDRISQRPVVCAGAVAGERNALMELLNTIVAEAVQRPFGHGHDQAILNHLCFTNRVTATILPNRGSLVWHLYGVPEAEVHVTANHEIVDRAGYVYPVVHMYDRIPQALAAVRARWTTG